MSDAMTDQPRVSPALSPEEWAEALSPRDRTGLILALSAAGRDQALAALCLYQQPFGFTHEDAEFLEDQRRILMSASYGRGQGSPIERRLASLVDRINALLPPQP